eukprot:3724939-Rhodomonas_salina.1
MARDEHAVPGYPGTRVHVRICACAGSAHAHGSAKIVCVCVCGVRAHGRTTRTWSHNLRTLCAHCA